MSQEWKQRGICKMKLDLNKEELCLISIALNAYQMETDNYHLNEMREVSTKIDNLYKVCTNKIKKNQSKQPTMEW